MYAGRSSGRTAMGLIAAANKNQIHQKSRDTSIAVVKRVNIYQPPMRGKRGLGGIGGRSQPFSKVPHEGRDLGWSGNS